MDSPSDSPLPPAAPRRLNGWKEIAAHLGKGVRTVQRWEAEYGLPVRRIGREGGEIVFAFRDEIDRWSLESRSRRDAKGTTSEPDEAESEPVAQPLPALDRRRRLTPWVWAGVATLTLVIGAAFSARGLTTKTRPQSPTRAIVEGGVLFASGPNREALWEYKLDFVPNMGSYEVVNPPAGHRKIDSQGLTVFNSDGSERFTVSPSPSVTFGSNEFSGPWSVYRASVTDNPDRSRSIWIAFIHGLWFPTLLVEVDARGATKSTYWSNGYIESMAVTRWNGADAVLVGATHNDTRGASLAIFDHGQVRGSAPAMDDKFKCKSCEAGGPKAFIVLPRRCVGRAVAGQATVAELWVDDRDRIHALVGEGPRTGPDFASNVWYTLDRDLSFLAGELTLQSKAFHERLEREGTLDHAFGTTDLKEIQQILTWNGTDFASLRTSPPTR
jgi:hypothetical protein